MGIAHLNGATGPADTSMNVTIPRLSANFTPAVTAGGGLDFRVAHNLLWRVQGDYVFTHFTSADNQIHDIVDGNVRVSTGPVWRF
ncbi:MAG TPA: hypothetical protein VFE06_02130 [Acidobacteriaceae bacterium]|nr:hypothetical protein [Acidobacteriaceae bacterium]